MVGQFPSIRALLREHRRDDEPPAVVARLGWRYHHIGIPTDLPRQGEEYIPLVKMYVSGDIG